MKQGVGFSVTINIIVIFIVIIFAFLTASLNYYKTYKVNRLISESIEKYEGYNDLAKAEIEKKLETVGYVKSNIKCKSGNHSNPESSYCIYWDENEYKNNTKFRVEVVTFMSLNIPIIDQTVKIPVKSKTHAIYRFIEG